MATHDLPSPFGIYDRNGNPITVEQWGQLHGDMTYKRVAETQVGPYWISTVWLGIDHGFDPEQAPLNLRDHGVRLHPRRPRPVPQRRPRHGLPPVVHRTGSTGRS